MPFISADCGGAEEIIVTGPSFGAYHAANFALEARDMSSRSRSASRGVYDVATVGWGERGDAVYFNNPADYVTHLDGDHLDWLRGQVNLLLLCRPGPVGGHDRRTREHAAVRRPAGREGHPPRARRLGPRVAARLAVVARAARAPPAALLLTGAFVGATLRVARAGRQPGPYRGLAQFDPAQRRSLANRRARSARIVSNAGSAWRLSSWCGSRTRS